MKVSTEACILGALVNAKQATRILDIGTGTGLLSLMLAQKSDAFIDAIEIDADAVAQATENVKESPWQQQINIIHDSIQHYSQSTNKKYNLIVSNPPFYQSHLKSPDTQTNLAIHNDSLSPAELAASVSMLLESDGQFYVLLPEHEGKILQKALEPENIFLHTIIKIHHRAEHRSLRSVFIYKKSMCNTALLEQLIIKDTEDNYTQAFRDLLKDYYLHF